MNVRANFRYLKVVLRHKWYVYHEGRKLGLPRLVLLIHDLSKFSRAEWPAYRNRFASGRAGKEDKALDPTAFKDAWWHHYMRNPHHWEFWIMENMMRHEAKMLWRVMRTYRKNESGAHVVSLDAAAQVYEMPEAYVREMIADWRAASRVYSGKYNCLEWYIQAKDRQVMHPDTRWLVEDLLGLHLP